MADKWWIQREAALRVVNSRYHRLVKPRVKVWLDKRRPTSN